VIGKRKKASFLYTRHAPIFGFPSVFSRLFSFVFAALIAERVLTRAALSSTVRADAEKLRIVA